ncbi:MAG: NADH-quinone oxidoreductase subunit NuoG [Anaerolineae bacterium]
MEPLVTLTIDDQEVVVPAGTLLLEAAKSIGIEIPTLCYYEKLLPLGGCRLCLVEIEKMRGLQTACTTPVREGMVVRTNTPEVIKTRQGMLEFLLINHPLDCPVCDKGGECDLQDWAFKYGATESRFVEEKRHKRKAHALSPLIVKDEERCILCRRCVRFLEQWADEAELDYFERGRLSRVDTFPGGGVPFDSVFSGNTVDVCPVGALTSRVFRFQARSWELERTSSICPYCGVGCNITLDVKMNKLRRIMARENADVNDQWLCDKGRFGHAFVRSPHRLKTPLIRRADELEPATWQEALTLIGQRLGEIVKESGPESVGGIGSTRATNEANYLFQRFMRAVVDTNNVDHIGRVPDGARPLGSLAEIREADVIFLMGVDPVEEAPLVELLIRRAVLTKGTKVIVANPRRVALNRYGGPWLAYKPGSEVVLLNALTELQSSKSKIQSSKVEEMTGVPSETLRQAAEMLAQAEHGIVIYGPASNLQSPISNLQLTALTNLALLTNSAGPSYLAENCNSLGALEMGVAPHLLPGRQSLSEGETLKRFGRRWGAELSSEAGLSADEMLKAATEEQLRAFYVMKANPATDCPGGKEALEKLDFLVVQDIFLTETAKLADVVLPAASFAETEGTFTNLAGRVQRLRGALRPPGQAKPDDQILIELAKVMGSELGYASAEEVMAEIARLALMYRNIGYGDWGEGGLPRAEGDQGSPALVKVEYQPPAGDERYLLALVTGRLLYDGGIRLGQSEIMRQFVPEPFVEINPADAEALGIADSAAVTVASSQGELKLAARVSEGIRPGCVFVPQNFAAAPVSTLLDNTAVVTWVKVTRSKSKIQSPKSKKHH